MMATATCTIEGVVIPNLELEPLGLTQMLSNEGLIDLDPKRSYVAMNSYARDFDRKTNHAPNIEDPDLLLCHEYSGSRPG
jgi:hypothetical protein